VFWVALGLQGAGVRRKYKSLKDGGTMELRDGVSHSVVCCDCGLVHDYAVAHTKNARVTVVTVTRDNRATGQKRRKSPLQQEINALKVCRDHWKASYEKLKHPKCTCWKCLGIKDPYVE
jgi:hypothetical protein